MSTFKNYKVISYINSLKHLTNCEPHLKLGIFHVVQDKDFHELDVFC
jgi:hypothetical protein